MRPLTMIVLIIVLLCTTLPACQPDRPLSTQIETLIAQVPEATVAVVALDPEAGAILAINADRSFHAASTMKVPVMIEVYRRAAQGDLALSDMLPVKNSFRSIVDGSTFAIEDDSDDAIYARIGEEMSIADLMDRMIIVSSNLATNLVIESVSADSVQQTALQLGAANIQVLRGVEDLKAYERGLSNTTTARDLAILLAAIARGEAVSAKADSAMVATLLRGRYNEMIPAGLPTDVRVAHKTGWITRIHHDAAIVYPAHAEPYILVILIEGIDDQDMSAALGAEIARAVHAGLVGDAD